MKYLKLQQQYQKYFSTKRSIQRRILSKEIQPGDIVHGFQLQKIQKINDFQLEAYTLQHQITKAQYIHFDTSDQNNTFSVQFKTIPSDSTGVPHILEHITLCGSKKFPVRDPFFKMLNRSLNTFMNAFTTPDMTCYPFSTQNEKDFYNLMDIYLDATFNPLIKKNDFMQEGWRYDFSEEGNPTTDLVFKGVVFNEMKGVYQSSSSYFQETIMTSLFGAQSNYQHRYGGYPTDIPSLTYENLLAFQNKYYHPSNAKFYSYGDLDFTNHLKFINDNYLQNVEFQKSDHIVNNAQRFDTPQSIVIKCPPDQNAQDVDKQVTFAMNYLCCETTTNQFDHFGLQFLPYLLFETPNSPLYQTLIESNVCSSFSPGYGYDSSMKEGIFSIGVSNINQNQIEEIEKIILTTLQEVVKNGFSKDLIEAQIHAEEINTRKPRANLGLSILMGSMNTYNHGGRVSDNLQVSQNIEQLRKEIQKGGFFERLIQKYLLNNSHVVKLTMIPDENDNYLTQLQSKETEMLKIAQQKLTQQDKQNIISQVISIQSEL